MKKIISFILAVTMILSLNTVAMADNSSLEAIDSGELIVNQILAEQKGALAKYVYTKTATQEKSDWGYHPQITTWQVVDGYNLSTSKTTDMSVTVSYGAISIKIASSISSGGYFVSADRTRGASRVKVGGTVAVDLYDAYIYDETGTLQKIVPNARKVFNAAESVLNYYAVYKNN